MWDPQSNNRSHTYMYKYFKHWKPPKGKNKEINCLSYDCEDPMESHKTKCVVQRTLVPSCHLYTYPILPYRQLYKSSIWRLMEIVWPLKNLENHMLRKWRKHFLLRWQMVSNPHYMTRINSQSPWQSSTWEDPSLQIPWSLSQEVVSKMCLITLTRQPFITLTLCKTTGQYHEPRKTIGPIQLTHLDLTPMT